jgi:Na+/serine symporter
MYGDRFRVDNYNVHCLYILGTTFTFQAYPICHTLTHTHTHILTNTYSHSHTHSGGIELIFNGTNLDVVESPMLVVNDPNYVNVTNVSQL